MQINIFLWITLTFSLYAQYGFSKVLFDTPSKTDCRFYLHLEEQLLCAKYGKSGSEYLPVYGYKYCNRFASAVAEKNWSTNQKQWVEGTTYCLQDALTKLGDNILPCSNMENKAFDAHPRCYHDNGICSLKISEELSIIGVAWNFDLLEKGKQSTVQFFHATGDCTKDWMTYMFSLLGRVFSQSDNFSDSERKKALALLENLPKSEEYLSKYFKLALAKNLFGNTGESQVAAAKSFSNMYRRAAIATERNHLKTQSICLTGQSSKNCDAYKAVISNEDKSGFEFLKKHTKNNNKIDFDSLLELKKKILIEETQRTSTE